MRAREPVSRCSPVEWCKAAGLSTVLTVVSKLARIIPSFTTCNVQQQGLRVAQVHDAGMAVSMAGGITFLHFYGQFFNAYNPIHIFYVRDTWNLTADALQSRVASEIDGDVCTDSTIAYVYPGGELKMWACEAYFTLPLFGSIDSRAGTMLHELSHEVLKTVDHAYGIDNARALAASNPSAAITNTDHYQYQAEYWFH